MFVKNNEARVHKIGASPAGGKGIVLMPGVNEVDSAAWSAAKEIVVVQSLLKSKVLEEVSAKAAATAGTISGATGTPTQTAPQTLAELKVEDAENLVAETYDRELLQKWKKADSRKTVLGAIDAQLDLVKVEESTKK